MVRLRPLGALERAVMDELWDADEALTVRQVHDALCMRRPLAYTTVMTVLRRLAGKGLVAQLRDARAHRYAADRGRHELVAGLMVDALDQVDDRHGRHAALVHFVERVGPHEVAALRLALASTNVQQVGGTSATTSA